MLLASLPADGLHASCPQGVHFVSLLDEGAAVAAEERQQIAHIAALDALLLADLLADLGAEDDVGDGDELDEAAHEAVLAHLLGRLTSRVAGHKVGDDAQTAVAEAAEKPI